jgi:zinc transporter, ZIP family
MAPPRIPESRCASTRTNATAPAPRPAAAHQTPPMWSASAKSSNASAAVTLDGVPENLALGVSLADSASYALLVAIFASNFPEALGSAVQMRERGEPPGFVVGVWAGAAVLLAASVVLGTSLLTGASGPALAILLGFAGGAVLASLAVTVFPQAFAHGGPYVALATVAGFLVAYLISEV